ncbi:MAG: hypothetical protein V3T83_02105 [Acidobacteriota bacterium]
MLDRSADDLRRKKMSRGKGNLPVLSYLLPTPLALGMFLSIVVVLALVYWLFL